MKIKDIINYLKTDYFLITNEENEYQVEYLKKNKLTDKILNSNLVEIEPVIAVKKSIFDGTANDSDFVAAIKLNISERPQASKEAFEDVYEEFETKTEPENDYYEEESRPNQANPFGFDPNVLSSFITPEMIDSFTHSKFFQDMMDPENMSKILKNTDFSNFNSNIDYSDILNNLFSSQNSLDYDDYDEYDEYEEYDDDEDDYEEY